MRFCTGANASGQKCAEALVDNYGKLLIGRALEAEEQTALRSVYTASIKTKPESDALRAVLEALVQMASFINRTEFGAPDKGPSDLKMTNEEIAAALASYLWEGPPDAELLAAAASGSLRNEPAKVEAQARRMFKDPRARVAFAKFVDQWLSIGSLETKTKDAKLFPDYSPAIAAAMRKETQTFIATRVFEGDASLKALFNAKTTYLNGALSKFYGFGNVTGEAFVEVALPPERTGLLSHGSVMTAHSSGSATSPIVRGHFVRSSLMCNEIPSVPPGAATAFPDDGKPKPTKGRFNQDQISSCKGCHVLMNPIGFGLEGLDPVGRYRKQDGDFPVDSSGSLNSASNSTSIRPFEANGVFNSLAEAPELGLCFTLRMYQYAMGRKAGSQDKEVLVALAAQFKSNNFKIDELMIGIVKSKTFTARVLP
jgi:Protein of unknown function (DUF1592)/Protein of unknown function (DUF1588)/Protein of unknown function (DUF1585)